MSGAGGATELFRLDGRVVVVTGASSGLGVAMARGVASVGATVVLVARRVERLEALAKELEDSGATAHALPCDVSTEQGVDDLVAEVSRRVGGAAVLVTTAGITEVPSAWIELLCVECSRRRKVKAELSP